MSHTLDESKKIIKFFKNRERPREILKIEYPKQLSLPPETRFCYSLLALKGLSEASNALKSLARATITENAALSSMKKEWVRLHQDYCCKLWVDLETASRNRLDRQTLSIAKKIHY